MYNRSNLDPADRKDGKLMFLRMRRARSGIDTRNENAVVAAVAAQVLIAIVEIEKAAAKRAERVADVTGPHPETTKDRAAVKDMATAKRESLTKKRAVDITDTINPADTSTKNKTT